MHVLLSKFPVSEAWGISYGSLWAGIFAKNEYFKPVSGKSICWIPFAKVYLCHKMERSCHHNSGKKYDRGNSVIPKDGFKRLYLSLFQPKLQHLLLPQKKGNGEKRRMGEKSPETDEPRWNWDGTSNFHIDCMEPSILILCHCLLECEYAKRSFRSPNKVKFLSTFLVF